MSREYHGPGDDDDEDIGSGDSTANEQGNGTEDTGDTSSNGYGDDRNN